MKLYEPPKMKRITFSTEDVLLNGSVIYTPIVPVKKQVAKEEQGETIHPTR